MRSGNTYAVKALLMLLAIGALALRAASADADKNDETDDDAAPPTAWFEASASTGPAPLEVAFTNLSQNAEHCFWYVDNVLVSREWNLVHVFDRPGVYWVLLRAGREAYWSSCERPIDVYVDPPENDACQNAIAVSLGERVEFSGQGASGTALDACFDESYGDVWFTFTPGTSGKYEISLYNEYYYYTLFAVYSGDCDALFEVACGENYYKNLLLGIDAAQSGLLNKQEEPVPCGCHYYEPTMCLQLEAGQTYLIRVACYDNDDSLYALTISEGCPETCCRGFRFLNPGSLFLGALALIVLFIASVASRITLALAG